MREIQLTKLTVHFLKKVLETQDWLPQRVHKADSKECFTINEITFFLST